MTDKVDETWETYFRLWAAYDNTPAWRFILRRRRYNAAWHSFHALATRGHQ